MADPADACPRKPCIPTPTSMPLAPAFVTTTPVSCRPIRCFASPQSQTMLPSYGRPRRTAPAQPIAVAVPLNGPAQSPVKVGRAHPDHRSVPIPQPLVVPTRASSMGKLTSSAPSAVHKLPSVTALSQLVFHHPPSSSSSTAQTSHKSSSLDTMPKQRLVVLKLFSKSCRACAGVAPRFRKMAAAWSNQTASPTLTDSHAQSVDDPALQDTRVEFAEMDFTENREFCADVLGVQSLPYFAIFRTTSKPTDHSEALQPPDIAGMLKEEMVEGLSLSWNRMNLLNQKLETIVARQV